MEANHQGTLRFLEEGLSGNEDGIQRKSKRPSFLREISRLLYEANKKVNLFLKEGWFPRGYFAVFLFAPGPNDFVKTKSSKDQQNANTSDKGVPVKEKDELVSVPREYPHPV